MPLPHWALNAAVKLGLQTPKENVSNEFRANPTEFLRIHAVSTTMLNGFRRSPSGNLKQGLEAGLQNFTLNQHISNGYKLACLESHDARSPALIRGYWVPQGSKCVIPVRPDNQDVFVFTPDFSGCSIRVDQINATEYVVYHVTGGLKPASGGQTYMQAEYENDAQHKAAWGSAAVMDPESYGSQDQPRGFAMMKYSEGAWHILFQGQESRMGVGTKPGVPELQGPVTVSRQGEIPVHVLTRPQSPVTQVPAASM